MEQESPQGDSRTIVGKMNILQMPKFRKNGLTKVGGFPFMNSHLMESRIGMPILLRKTFVQSMIFLGTKFQTLVMKWEI